MRRAWWLSLFLYSGCFAFSQTVAAPVDKTIEVAPSPKWTDSGIDLHSDDLVDISAQTTGSGSNLCDPQGMLGANDNVKRPVETLPPGALIAKLQERSDAPIFVGAVRQLKITESGRLFFSANLASDSSCAGKYTLKVHVAPQGAAAPSSYQSKLENAAQIWMSGQFGAKPAANTTAGEAALPAGGGAAGGGTVASAPVLRMVVSPAPLDGELDNGVQSLPRRVNDEFKNLGDIVNFVLVGSEKQVQDALAAANWHVADTSTPGAVAKAILLASEKEDYLQMPMSQLYLFDRVQDFGYEQAEPYAMVASRHHFRIWKSQVTYKGQIVWAGAGTHDIGFEKDRRNGKITHKIDPAVDGERDHIGESLQLAGRVRSLHYFQPSDPVLESKNATGGGLHSDGRVLVIFLQ